MKTLVTIIGLMIISSSAFADNGMLKCSFSADRNVYKTFDTSVNFEIPAVERNGSLKISAQDKVTDLKMVNHVIDVNTIKVFGGTDLVLTVWKHDGETGIGPSITTVGALMKDRTVVLNTGTEELSCTLK